MIYPWDIARFRAALDAGLAGQAFERFAFRRVVVQAVEGGGAAASGRAIEMHGPAAVFGRPAVPACLDGVAAARLPAPDARVHRIDRGTIVGLNAVLDAEGHLYAPAPCHGDADLFRALRANQSNAEGYVLRHEQGSYVACFFAGRVQRRIPQTALLLSNLEIGNYGSFLIRVLPQLLQAKRVGHPFDCYVSADRSGWLQRAIELIGLPSKPIFLTQEVSGDTFDCIYTHVTPCVEGLFDSTSLTECRRLVPDGRRGGGRRRLYVSRQLSRIYRPHYRQLLNEADVVDRVRKRGFEIVYPETLDFAEQIRTFAEAKRIVGPSGSGMLNAIFSDAGARVLDLEGFNVTVRQHAKVYSSAGHEYAFCFGRFADEDSEATVRSWTVDLDEFDRACAWLEG